MATLDSAPPIPTGKCDPVRNDLPLGASSRAMVSPMVTTDPVGAVNASVISVPVINAAAA
jgi:hypothetical protein